MDRTPLISRTGTRSALAKNSFNNHTEGWVTLYDYTLGSHRTTLETSQLLLPSGLVAVNNGVRATYDGTVYIFHNGEVPVPDIYYEQRELEENLVFPYPHIKVVVQGGHARPPINYFYIVSITTYMAVGCTGLCCDVEVDTPVESPKKMQADPDESDSEDQKKEKKVTKKLAKAKASVKESAAKATKEAKDPDAKTAKEANKAAEEADSKAWFEEVAKKYEA